MIIESMTGAQIGALTASATATIKIVEPTVAGALSFAPMAGAVVKVNGVAFVEGVDWTAATDADTTASSLADAIHAATADVLCDAAASGAFVVLTANADGPDGNLIAVSVTKPGYTFPSGSHLTGGALPEAGTLLFNTDDNSLYVYNHAGAVWIGVSAVVPTAWGTITGTLANQTDLQAALDAKADAV